MPSTTEPQKARIPELDGLRALAILLVILYHYLAPMQSNATGWRFATLTPARVGWIGVDLFFVVSGYLIASILIANRESRTFFATFYIRRFCRILPLYLPLAVIFYFLHARSSARPQPPLLTDLTFTQNFWMASAASLGGGLLAVTWSLAVEEQFYLLLPALVRFNRPRRLIVIVTTCIGMAIVLRYAFLVAVGRDAFIQILVLLPTRLDSLMIGVAAAWLASRGHTISRGVLWTAWVSGAIWIVGVSMTRTIPDQGIDPVRTAMSGTVIAMFCVATLLIAIGGGFRFLRWRGLTYIGMISYGLYLLHLPAMMLMKGVAPWLGSGLPIAAFAVAFAASALSWELYEKRFVRYGHRFLYERDSSAASEIDHVEPFPLVTAGDSTLQR
jgi:peptidoglycan/LPS O-acetylase OafA/YrhL